MTTRKRAIPVNCSDRCYARMKRVKEYNGGYLLADRKTGKLIFLTLWYSENDAIADGKISCFTVIAKLFVVDSPIGIG